MSEQPIAPPPTNFAPFIDKAVMTIAGTDVSVEVENVRWTPAESVAWNPVSGHVITASAGWNLAMRVGEDWENPNSLANYIYDHEGEIVTATFKPKGAGTIVWESEVTLALQGVGGARGVAATDATFGSTRPVRKVATA